MARSGCDAHARAVSVFRFHNLDLHVFLGKAVGTGLHFGDHMHLALFELQRIPLLLPYPKINGDLASVDVVTDHVGSFIVLPFVHYGIQRFVDIAVKFGFFEGNGIGDPIPLYAQEREESDQHDPDKARDSDEGYDLFACHFKGEQIAAQWFNVNLGRIV